MLSIVSAHIRKFRLASKYVGNYRKCAHVATRTSANDFTDESYNVSLWCVYTDDIFFLLICYLLFDTAQSIISLSSSWHVGGRIDCIVL